MEKPQTAKQWNTTAGITVDTTNSPRQDKGEAPPLKKIFPSQDIEALIQQAKAEVAREIFEEIEGFSEVLDWEGDLGKMREFKEEKWQSLKSKYTGVKEAQ